MPMNSNHTLAIITISMFASLGVIADENNSAETKSYPISINAEMGSTGLGGKISWRFLDHFGVRGGIPKNELSHQQQDLEDAVKIIKFWPVLKLYVSFQF